MGWFRIALTAEEQSVVRDWALHHADPKARASWWVILLLHHGDTREQAAERVGVSRATVFRYVEEFRERRLESFRKDADRYVPVSELDRHQDAVRQSFEQQPVATIAEACQRIADLTGVRRGPTQVRKFLTKLGMKWRRVRAIPVPPKKVSRNIARLRPSFSIQN